MKFTWLGHAGFRIEVGGQVLLLDPWLRGNPMFDEARFDEAIAGASHVLLTHAHFDHVANAAEISKTTGAPVVGMYDFMGQLAEKEGVETVGFNKGGTVMLGDVAVTMVNAVHSSTLPGYTPGTEAGFMISHGGRTAYVSGDTDVMADMAVFQALHEPQIGVLACGGHFTMDQRRAAWAARTYFRFETVIPCHYRTFPLLAQDAEVLKAELPGVAVKEPEVMVALEV